MTIFDGIRNFFRPKITYIYGGDYGVNVANMINKSRGEYAYTMLDLEAAATKEIMDEIGKIDGVIRTRIIK